MLELNLIKVFIPWIVSFVIGLSVTPIILAYLYKYKVWPKNKNIRDKLTIPDEDGNIDSGKIMEVINKDNTSFTPRMGGLVIVFSVLFTGVLFWIISYGFFNSPSGKIDFVSRSQTWIIFGSFITGAIIGYIDDSMTIKNIKWWKFHHGFPWQFRILLVLIFSFFIGWWFQYKLGYSAVLVPFLGHFDLGIFFIPFFMAVFSATYATTNIDGLDGLAGGIMATIYSTMGFIAWQKEMFDISAFCFVVVGGILAFLWFNVAPARFYMSEVGYAALAFVLPIIAFITDTVLFLPLIAFMLFINLIVTVLQRCSIICLRKRIFRAAPLHHHFELAGWSQSQIVLRYWIISMIMAVLAVALISIS